MITPAQIMIRCDNCGKAAKVSAVHAGKRGQCSECGESVLVPTYVSTEDAEAMPQINDPFATTFPVPVPPTPITPPSSPPLVPKVIPPVLPWYFKVTRWLAYLQAVLSIGAFGFGLLGLANNHPWDGLLVIGISIPVLFLSCLTLVGLDMAEFRYLDRR